MKENIAYSFSFSIDVDENLTEDAKRQLAAIKLREIINEISFVDLSEQIEEFDRIIEE